MGVHGGTSPGDGSCRNAEGDAEAEQGACRGKRGAAPRVLEREGSPSQHLSKMGCEEWRGRGCGRVRLCTCGDWVKSIKETPRNHGKSRRICCFGCSSSRAQWGSGRKPAGFLGGYKNRTKNPPGPQSILRYFLKRRGLWWQGAGSWLGSLLPFGCLGAEVPVLPWLPPRAGEAECSPHCPSACPLSPPPPASCSLLPLQKQTGEGTLHGPCACKCLFQIPAV